MRASVLTGVGQMELRDVPVPSPAPGEVLVEVAAVGICGTDFHIYSGESNYNFDDGGTAIPLERDPQILGHEITGVVRELGPVRPGEDVSGLTPGRRVVIDQGRNCHSEARTPVCEYCESGDSHQCEFFTEHGITGIQGGFAELVSVPAINCIPTDAELSPEELAMTEPLGCVLHSSERAAHSNTRYLLNGEGDRRVRNVLVCGGGPAGLLFVQVLRQVYGFEGPILLSEPNEKKRRLAQELGADPIDPAAGDWVEQVRERTQGRGVEYLVEASGSGPIFADLPNVMRKQATLLLYGIGHGGASLELLNQIQWKEPTCVLSVGASGGFDADRRPAIYRSALELIEAGRVDVRRLVTHRYDGLDAIPGAFAGDHHTPEYVKGIAVLGEG